MTDKNIIVDLQIVESYRRTVPVETLIDHARDVDPELAQLLEGADAPAIAARLHRLQLDDPQHPVIQRIWVSMEYSGEVASETWAFTPEQD